MADAERVETYYWPELSEEFELKTAEFVPISLCAVVTSGGTQHSALRESPATSAQRQAAADRLLESARRQAEEIRQQIKEQAAQEAHQKLEAAVRAVTSEQATAFEQARDRLLQELREAFEQRLAEIEEEMLSLIAAMAEKVIRRKLEADDEIVLAVVRETLEQAAGANQITVRISPSDEPLVREAQQTLLAALGPVEELQIIADEQIFPGGCLVETERGKFDARIDTQLQLLSEEVDRLLKAG